MGSQATSAAVLILLVTLLVDKNRFPEHNVEIVFWRTALARGRRTGAVGTWAKSELLPGQALRPPAPLFKKLDESVVEEEYARLAG